MFTSLISNSIACSHHDFSRLQVELHVHVYQPVEYRCIKDSDFLHHNSTLGTPFGCITDRDGVYSLFPKGV